MIAGWGWGVSASEVDSDRDVSQCQTSPSVAISTLSTTVCDTGVFDKLLSFKKLFFLKFWCRTVSLARL